ncbi:DUF6221 family protein [Streptomyces sp. NBRC 110035]|uniref:DUF6221 family protein n=1 Tax=Streptomyces sp. NBRC 110035 TaxID=1547867 RepID=UPI000698D539|nr:DUF6221 family protein [Streptomyces sp. NBRC 110035]
MDELVQWLGEQLDADAAHAMAAAEELGPGWYYDDGFVLARGEGDLVATGSQDFLELKYGEHIAAHDPARVLREIGAKRQLLRQYEHLKYEVTPDDLSGVWALEAILYAFAAVYVDRPGFREEWRP